ncbi:MAG: trypsin-like peptidase domain-containing protein [Planctomycetes bacterium]|nr:trypsin-like peptidase domain-containing protein [Planctomycetota bacterium]
MKKLLLMMVLGLGVLAAPAQLPVVAQESPATAGVAKLDTETRELVKRIYPAFVLIGGGSGVCISEDGYMVTNHHVFSDAVRPSKMVVRMAGNTKEYTAEAVGADPRGDIVLAKLKLKDGEKVPFVKLADSDKVNIGDICICIGNPFLLSGIGVEPTVSVGTVSATHRFQGGYSDAIQIDTAINPGNSGGPSFNLDGEVIGINGRNISSHTRRFNTGAGFAIPANQIKAFMDAFKAESGGAFIVRHGMVSGLRVDLGAKEIGALVTDVAAGSDAEEAGFKKGDVITAMDGVSVFNGYRYYGVIGIKPRGSTFVFTGKRGSEPFEISARNDMPVEAGQFNTIPRPDEDARAQPSPFDPFRLPPPKSTLACKVNVNADRKVGGYVITSFTQDGDGNDSPLEAAGLSSGDIITHVNGRRITHFCDFSDVMIALDPGTKVKVKFMRQGGPNEVEVALGKYRPAR